MTSVFCSQIRSTWLSPRIRRKVAPTSLRKTIYRVFSTAPVLFRVIYAITRSHLERAGDYWSSLDSCFVAQRNLDSFARVAYVASSLRYASSFCRVIGFWIARVDTPFGVRRFDLSSGCSRFMILRRANPSDQRTLLFPKAPSRESNAVASPTYGSLVRLFTKLAIDATHPRLPNERILMIVRALVTLHRVRLTRTLGRATERSIYRNLQSNLCSSARAPSRSRAIRGSERDHSCLSGGGVDYPH